MSDIEILVGGLEQTHQQTLTYFALDDQSLEKSYAPNKWSVRYILHHLADAESVLYDRVRRVISTGKQVIWAFDQDAWANRLDYQNRPMSVSKGIYMSIRQGVIYQARAHYETLGQLEFVHSETGLRTLKDEFDKIVWHNERHLEQIKKALS
ncbi:MAG: DinB family protein [Deinococcales bacterium]